jgi:DNA-binding transcriptional LysR family regulator
MNWDDLRYVLAVSKQGSLMKAARVLGVDHTTVGRRVEAAEAALGVRLFTRTTTGLVQTADAARLLASMHKVEDAVVAVERAAAPHPDRLEGKLTVTAPETFGVSYLAPWLAAFGVAHPGVQLELVPAGAVLDLGRGEAEVAVRTFRSTSENLLVRRVGSIAYGLYGAADYLLRHPVSSKAALHEHPILSSTDAADIEGVWLRRLNPRATPVFTSTFSLALLGAARASAGLAILPRYLGDAEPTLELVPMPDPPAEPIWLTVHQDLRGTPRVRALLEFLAARLKKDAPLLQGR